MILAVIAGDRNEYDEFDRKYYHMIDGIWSLRHIRAEDSFYNMRPDKVIIFLYGLYSVNEAYGSRLYKTFLKEGAKLIKSEHELREYIDKARVIVH